MRSSSTVMFVLLSLPCRARVCQGQLTNALLKVAIHQCDFLVDLNTGVETMFEVDFSKLAEWKPVFCHPFLSATKTPQLHRVLYIPGQHAKHAVYDEYCVFERVTATP
eukprot:m.217114 g.217114  ORF g.217114 m.217114 type:complete len:108 (-) comp10785_c1_seq17:759-1082(-)